jgi:hypothetical protein
MSKLAISLVAALAATFAGHSAMAEGTGAPSTTVEQRIQSFSQWTSTFQDIIARMVGVLSGIPEPPDDSMSAQERSAWAVRAREWAQRSDAEIAELQARVARMPSAPPEDAPITPELRVALQSSRARLPQVLTAVNDISRGYVPIAEAFERRQDGAVPQLRVRAVDATLLTLDLMQNMNASQAAAMPANNPQGSLLMSYARSYDGFIALLRLKRDILATQRVDPALEQAATRAMREAALQVRDLVRQGQARTQAMLTMAASAPRTTREDVALIEFVNEMMATYGPSFERELRIADELDAMADILARPHDYIAIEPELDQHMERFGQYDVERIEDAQRRQQVMSRR